MKGVLLVNLGSPDTPNPKDVRRYLDEFLMDERVIDTNVILRNILVRGIILNTRPKKSAEAYQKIWWDEGSPLIVLSERFHKKVVDKTDIPVALGMRYGSMSIKEGYQKLADQGVTEVLLVPLYPHYAMSSFETVEVKAKQVQKKFFPEMTTEVLPAFFNKPDYIKVMADNIRKNIKGFEHDHILFSYHGIPERHILKSDTTGSHCKLDGSCCNKPSKAHATCYRHQCFETTKEIVKELGLKEGTYSNSFQSRLGRDPWLKPYTDFEFERLPQEEGKKKLAVITPAFVSDCLETLEEIAMEGEEQFKEGGGESYKHIPCLNDNDDWVAVMVDWINQWKN
ncbi:ferrochelatase [Flavicella sp.]|uniref:ferrochelatase n=1 Tax=Flavicella sp. TaxID=2957742 RepID=UPI00262C890E|nr:ferrochelatase [Flavicella sp.]MDG1803876.1 ferrochelatase [Flavicella sp.]MDG2280814.1 ferrochelatase [Flavicella sp.]